MGQPQQLFLVARVRPAAGKPKEYRCVAAFHHNWCYGKVPLHCVNRSKNLARSKANAALIQRDLDRYPWGVKTSTVYPCPYISFLAHAAFGTDIHQREGDLFFPYFDRISELSADSSSGSHSAVGGEGIAVIDVAVPDALAYCFVAFRHKGDSDGDEVPCRVPLSAAQYLRSYYPAVLDPLANERDQRSEAANVKAIIALDDIPVLALDVLIATWPKEYDPNLCIYDGESDPSNPDSEDSERSTSPSNSDGSERSTSSSDSPADDGENPPPSHSAMTARRAESTPANFANAVAPFVKDSMDFVNDISGRTLSLAWPDSPGIVVPLFPASFIDLSHRILSPDGLILMLREVEPFTRLDLSYNHSVDKATFAQILLEHRLEWVNIVGCDITGEDITDLLKTQPSLFQGVEAIVHPFFLSRDSLIGSGKGIPNALRCYYGGHRAWVGSSGWVSLPFFGIDQIVQNLTDLLEAHECHMLNRHPEPAGLRSIIGASYRYDG